MANEVPPKGTFHSWNVPERQKMRTFHRWNVPERTRYMGTNCAPEKRTGYKS